MHSLRHKVLCPTLLWHSTANQGRFRDGKFSPNQSCYAGCWQEFVIFSNPDNAPFFMASFVLESRIHLHGLISLISWILICVCMYIYSFLWNCWNKFQNYSLNGDVSYGKEFDISYLVGGWSTHLNNMLKSNWISSPLSGSKIKISETFESLRFFDPFKSKVKIRHINHISRTPRLA